MIFTNQIESDRDFCWIHIHRQVGFLLLPSKIPEASQDFYVEVWLPIQPHSGILAHLVWSFLKAVLLLFLVHYQVFPTSLYIVISIISILRSS